ncbi:hypothetical protein RRG08_053741 [Elysia crispata]|uniref:Uncharacterized protein n=1 Tax=Elysia crispata TaxID=231223 RepID=A0AAE0XXN5_9GAST|nr:hypothetical protein RRG08_053741 [Elysia crispata]
MFDPIPQGLHFSQDMHSCPSNTDFSGLGSSSQERHTFLVSASCLLCHNTQRLLSLNRPVPHVYTSCMACNLYDS